MKMKGHQLIDDSGSFDFVKSCIDWQGWRGGGAELRDRVSGGLGAGGEMKR